MLQYLPNMAINTTCGYSQGKALGADWLDVSTNPSINLYFQTQKIILIRSGNITPVLVAQWRD